jgi:hypothetical protein
LDIDNRESVPFPDNDWQETTLKKFFTGLLIGACLGGALGFAGGIFLFPYLFPPPEVNETVTGRSDEEVLARGRFVHADPSDPIHFGEGGVRIYDDILHLEADFMVGPGPKYHVYLVPRPDVTPDTRVQDTMFIDLGRLKAFSGSQNYPLPKGLNIERYGSVVIWCEQFNVLISPAALTLGSN